MSLIRLTCASSGLPIGYLPAALRKHYAPCISFSSIPLEATRKLVSHAVNSSEPESLCDADRQFAFMVLLHKLPAWLVDFHSLPRPDFSNQRIRDLCSPKGMRIFAEFVEFVLSIEGQHFTLGEDASPRKYKFLLPRYRIVSEFSTNTSRLEDFPGWLASCVNLIHSETERDRAERYKRPLLSRFASKESLFSRPRKLRNEVFNIFDSRRSTPAEIKNYANQLAAFFEQEPSALWHRFVAEPHTFEVEQIERILRDARAYNAGLDRVDEFMALSYQFVSWLDAALLLAQAQIRESQELSRSIAESDLISLQEHNVPDPQALIDKFTNPLRPRREQFKSIVSYLSALDKFEAAQKLLREAQVSPPSG